MKDQLKKAATAILIAQRERDKSWNGKEYKKSISSCYQKHFEEINLDKDLLTLLQVSSFDWNVIRHWAMQVLKNN